MQTHKRLNFLLPAMLASITASAAFVHEDTPDAAAVQAAADKKAADKAAKAQAAADAKAQKAAAKAQEAADAKAKKEADAKAKADKKAADAAAKAAKPVVDKAALKAAADQAKADKKAKKEADEAAKAQAKADAKAAKEAARMPEQNGIRRPGPNGICGHMWRICDELSAKQGSPVASATFMAECAKHNYNEVNARGEYARWRKFFGVTGRINPPAAPAAPAAA